jgi:membrane-anchored glycerophosphoryl diester phosphodiesterase (GDPDase)
MYEVPLAIEEDITASQTIQRSWSLTKNHVGRVFLTLTVAFLISIPIYIIVQIIVSILQGVLLRVVAAEPTSVGFQILSIIVGYVLGLVSGALLLPFWQAIKAVVYYDLRSRREGLGMQLRDERSR